MEFKKISETEILAEVPEGASVLGIVDGAVKQLPTDGMGGGKTLIIKQNSSSSATANMSLDEAMLAFENCELHSVFLYVNPEALEGVPSFTSGSITDGFSYFNQQCLIIEYRVNTERYYFFWTVDGISSEEPGDVS